MGVRKWQRFAPAHLGVFGDSRTVLDAWESGGGGLDPPSPGTDFGFGSWPRVKITQPDSPISTYQKTKAAAGGRKCRPQGRKNATRGTKEKGGTDDGQGDTGGAQDEAERQELPVPDADHLQHLRWTAQGGRGAH